MAHCLITKLSTAWYAESILLRTVLGGHLMESQIVRTCLLDDNQPQGDYFSTFLRLRETTTAGI